MLDSRKVYVENDNLILDLVNRENSMQQLDVQSPVRVQLSENGKTIQLIHNSLVLNGVVARPLIHQLGGRAWEQNRDFKLIDADWKQKFKHNRAELEQELAAVFSHHELSIRYEANKAGTKSGLWHRHAAFYRCEST